jgi:hypothetical protein
VQADPEGVIASLDEYDQHYAFFGSICVCESQIISNVIGQETSSKEAEYWSGNVDAKTDSRMLDNSMEILL